MGTISAVAVSMADAVNVVNRDELRWPNSGKRSRDSRPCGCLRRSLEITVDKSPRNITEMLCT